MKSKDQQNLFSNALAFSNSQYSIQIPENSLLFKVTSSCILQEMDGKIVCLTFDEIYNMDLSDGKIHSESMHINDPDNRSGSMTIENAYWASPDTTN